MEPVFTLLYSEYRVANLLANLFKSQEGYSVFVPLSRQQKGVDLLLGRRQGNRWCNISFQVKSSRTYFPERPKDKATQRFSYTSWFNTFSVADEADFFLLLSLYPHAGANDQNILASGWDPLVLVFSNAEMREFIANVKTCEGKPDRMFGFGWDSPRKVVLGRGDETRSGKDYARFAIENRREDIERALTASS